MRFRLGFLAGFGTGYYLGSMAGRERFEQINRMARKVKRSDAFDTATDRAKEAVDLGVDRAKEGISRARDLVASKRNNGDEPELGTNDPFGRAGTPPPAAPPPPPPPPPP